MLMPLSLITEYTRADFVNITISIQIELTASHQKKKSAMAHVEDITITQIMLLDDTKLILARMYVQQRVPHNDLNMFVIS